jgi:hypothetical protein
MSKFLARDVFIVHPVCCQAGKKWHHFSFWAVRRRAALPAGSGVYLLVAAWIFQVTCPLLSAATAALEKVMELLTTRKRTT